MSPIYYYGEGDPKERFQFWLDHPLSAIAIDVETISLEERHPLGFAIAFTPYEAVYFELSDIPRELELVIPMLQDIRIAKICHNSMFDLSVFPLVPVVGDKLNRSNVWDTNVAARLLGYLETSLPVLSALKYDNMLVSTKDLLARYRVKTLKDVPPMEVASMCVSHVKATYKLYMDWRQEIEDKYGEYFKVEMEVIPILIDLSMRGVLLDQEARNELADSYGKDVDFYRGLVQAYGIDNPGSSQQVGYMLGKRGNFLPLTRSKKQLSTAKGTLEFLDDPLASAVQLYRTKSKFKSTYLDPIEGQERFYTEYYLDTAVGRMNSRNRNIQNIPPDARHMMLPDSGVFVHGDYGKEHMFILAHMSQDRDLLRVLYDPNPDRNDVHQHTADRMGITRRIAKVVNYSMPYGGTAKTIKENGKIRDIRICERLLEGWFRTYTGAADWILNAQKEGLRDGWALPTVFGRRIRIPEEGEERMKNKAVNYPILGSDGEIIKRAIILCNHRRLGPPVMAITVHDSIDWDGDVEKEVIEIKPELEMIPGFRIPFEVKSTFRWE